jgi:hypothetical protein
MACPDYKALLPRYVDGELPQEQERLLKDHLPTCDSCRGTIRLLKMEDRAIRSALFGPGSRARSVRVPIRFIRAAVIYGLIFGTGLLVLYGAYQGLAERVDAAKRNEALEAALDRTVLVSADGLDVDTFLEEVSAAAGVELVLTETGRARLGDGVRVRIRLVKPIRLASLLELIEDFYGLVPEPRDGAVILR